MNLNSLGVLSLVAATVLLSACGGNNNTVTPSPITGLAAVGAPISSGVLSAVDAGGRTASTTIADDGTYSIDFLSRLQPPVLIKAEGVSGGRSTVHFGVITSTTATTVNVTPVSTAVVAQVMQADPGVVFATADTSKIALLTTSQVTATNAIIGNVLSAARIAAGISGDGALDFLTTPFSADKTGLDKLLDLVKISIQPDQSVHVKNKTSDGVAIVSSAGNLSGNLGTVELIDTAGIDLLGKDLQAAFRGGWKINSELVVNLFSNDFFQEGVDKSTIIRWISEDFIDMQGVKVLPAKILNCSINDFAPICDVLFTIKYSDGAFEPFIFPVRREGGYWKIYGDQSPVYTEYGAVVYRTVSGNNSVETISGFNIQVDDDAVIGDTKVGYVKAWFGRVTESPDRSPDFVFVNPKEVAGSCNNVTSGGFLRILTNQSDNNTCQGNFARLSDNRIDQLRASFSNVRPKITVFYYDVDGNRIPNAQHVINVEALPLKPSEVTDGYFATVTDSSWSQFAAANLKTEFTLVVSKGASVGLEDVIGAGPLGSSLDAQRLPFSTVRTGSSWRVLKTNNSLITVTRDADGRMYWYQRQE